MGHREMERERERGGREKGGIAERDRAWEALMDGGKKERERGKGWTERREREGAEKEVRGNGERGEERMMEEEGGEGGRKREVRKGGTNRGKR